MKKILLFHALILCTFSVFGQVTDDFSDGNFSFNPAWAGDTDKFIINSLFQLQLSAPPPTSTYDTAYLQTSNSRLLGTEWQFFTAFNFAPSDQNYLRVYLASDQSNLKDSLNGYFLQFGSRLDTDAIDLYLQDGTIEKLIAHGIDGHVANPVSITVKVVRDESGNWSVYSDLSGGTIFSLEATGTDTTFITTNYFGFLCRYSSTRASGFYFDNVYIGPPVSDTIAPSVSSLIVQSSNQLDVIFSEPVDTASSENLFNYIVNNGVGNPISAAGDSSNPDVVHLTFGINFPNGLIDTLVISGVKDFAGNIINDTAVGFSFYTPKQNDIIINEIMADPDPPIGLPNSEYTELYNRTSYPVNLAGWSFSDSTSSVILPPFVLPPNGYVLLCSQSYVSAFSVYGAVIGLSSAISLNNEGDVLTLSDASGLKINSVSYNATWYHDATTTGGRSLELIDPGNFCGGFTNWSESKDLSGGTPDRQNSIYASNPDTVAPQLLEAVIVSLTEIDLFFSEALDNSSASDLTHYSISPSETLISVIAGNTDFSLVKLFLGTPLDSSTIYTISIHNISDLCGNINDGISNASLELAIPASISIGDLIINEILFNPKTGGYDYVEIYNKSNKIFDLKDLRIATTDANDSLLDIISPVPNGYSFFPQQYVVFTENPDAVKLQYAAQNPEWFIKTPIPSLSNTEGVMVLLNSSLQRIDQLHYYESWQFPLLASDDGVALERISFNAPTQDSSNWHSAASTAGYGTPSYKNSEYYSPEATNAISITPQVFSPDNDGFNDIVSVNYQFDKPGYTANATVYDAQGRKIIDIVKNQIVGQSGNFTWDGIDNNGEKSRLGIYIIYLEVFDLNGNVKHYKKACALGGKKN
ncbi:MAG: lamin tail domain-containing protein [Chitinophagales bacterium]|nr:lamin tail domain-containing protein [Chitinophagales bacterium]